MWGPWDRNHWMYAWMIVGISVALQSGENSYRQSIKSKFFHWFSF